MEYQYPFSIHWTTEEVIKVIEFFQMIEKAYEHGVSREQLLTSYREFKKIVPSKAEERKMTDEFEEVSNYSTYRTIQKAKPAEDQSIIKM